MKELVLYPEDYEALPYITQGLSVYPLLLQGYQ
jgi:hypothetical protein